ncbi:hypothetical protein TIFTF001_003916 [Ficus carica]|uniref:F-box associated beta-propeller type 1 domain-containing protein n=1 Tax=Ficus carica TaxID=3494 RepID=A0AA87ZTQ7_FICCA|nr:hypothetical protein TIFTF001_003916 [Ficus carica]
MSNPAIKEFRILPQPMPLNDFIMRGAGLGYDSRADTYKFVRFGCDVAQNTIAEMYNMRSNSWREIGIDLGIDGEWIALQRRSLLGYTEF